MLDDNELVRAAALHAFLRTCRDRANGLSRGGMRQRDVATAAGISLSLYKRLEAGKAHNVRLDTLVRVASALGLRPSEQARLLSMARPDLATLTQAPGVGGQPTGMLGALRRASLAMARSRDAEELFQAAGRSLASLLGVEAIAYLLHPDGGIRLKVKLSFGPVTGVNPSLSGLTLPLPAALRHGRCALVRLPNGTRGRNVSSATTSLTLVPVRVRGEIVAALGIALATGSDRPARVAVVETVSAVLEVALANLDRRR